MNDVNFAETSECLPVLPLRGVAVFPYMITHLDIGRDISMKALEESLVRDRRVLLLTQHDVLEENPGPGDLYEVGTVAEIKQVLKLPGGVVRVLVEGLHRGRVTGFVSGKPWLEARTTVITDESQKIDHPYIEAYVRTAVYQFEQWVKLGKKISQETMVAAISVDDPGRLADIIASHLALKIEDKMTLLEAFDIRERLERLCEILSQELEIMELETKISLQVRKQLEKNQKDYYLREKIKAIHKELGEGDEKQEINEYRARLEEQEFPAAVRAKIEKELNRLSKMHMMSAESGVVRTYIECLLDLPWSRYCDERLDVDHAGRILDEDHYGLEKVKERILEYLAVRQLNPGGRGSIICLVGPPGVGKTSLAKSIARALQRKFVRMSLGGVRDEAEIRGHRRTYIGALPGRIIQGMRTAGVVNPLFLLDEIDKLSSDYRGDPSAALLEVLDREQNNTFTDHYLELPYDLSRVMWILTANSTHTIPRALLDRMEVIQIPGYTEEEKLQIAKRYLIPKQTDEHGIKRSQIAFRSGVVEQIIRQYTREAGVRELERNVAALCRKVARLIVQKRRARITISHRQLTDMLGVAKYRRQQDNFEDMRGVAIGLAWTEFGGDVLPVEVVTMEGKGNLNLTGQLGEVMQESARAGFAYIRSRAGQWGIGADFHEKLDVHVHIPEGAIPKDGPSAGITMATAILSALTGRKVRGDTAMTGEITLRGRVTAVGGIKEKVLAARRRGIHRVVLPADNGDDLRELPEEVRSEMTFITVSTMDEVLAAVLRSETDGLARNQG
ncbi:MAG: endopeptidase La [Negativicutes bacterium]|nr:endopeptidase La [Negativicutes bacterium]